MPNQKSDIAIYETDSGSQVEINFSNDGGWMTQDQIASAFDTTVSNVSQHLSNIFTDGELDRGSNSSKSKSAPNRGTNL